MRGRWDFTKPSRHGDYGVFVGTYDGMNVEILHEPSGRGECFVVIHDNTPEGLTTAERNEIAKSAVMQAIYFNDVECYHWCFDWKVAGHWCEMWHGNDDEPYYLAQHINVFE